MRGLRPRTAPREAPYPYLSESEAFAQSRRLRARAVRASASSRRQRGRTFTCSSRKIGWPSSASISGRARRRSRLHHRAALADDDLLLRLGLDVDVRADDAGRRSRPPRPMIACGTSSASGPAPSRGRARRPATSTGGRCAARAGSRPGLRAAARPAPRAAPSIPSPVFALTGWSAWKSPSFDGGVHLGRDVARLQPVDLVQGDHDRDAELEDPLRDEPVAGADPLARRQDEQDARRHPRTTWSTVRCMRSVSGSSGRWKPGRSASTSW